MVQNGQATVGGVGVRVSGAIIGPVDETLGPNDYRCSNCGGVFEKGWTDEEAQAEAAQAFGAIDEPVLVCDNCYQQIQGWGRRTGELDQERARLAAITKRPGPL